MKTPIVALTLAALFVGFSSDTAEAAKVKRKVVTKTIHKSPFGHKVVQKQKVVNVRKSGHGHGHGHGYGHGHNGFSASFSFGAPIAYAPAVVTPVVYAPSYHFIHKQVWVAAVTQQVFVGYTQCGSPIYNTVIVEPACYKTARYKVYPTGPQIFVSYID